MDDGCHFHAIGSDILDGRGTDFARYIGQILGPIIVVPSHLGAKIIPHHARAHMKEDVLVVTRNFLNKLDVGMQDGAFKILGEQQIAATTDV